MANRSTDEYLNHVRPKNLLLGGYNNKTTRIWQSDSNDRHDPNDFMLPVFVVTDPDAKREIKGLPNVHQYGVNELIKFLRPLVEIGLRSVLVFPVLDEPDKGLADSKYAKKQHNPAISAIEQLKLHFPGLLLAVDVCLCIFSESGHCCEYTEAGQIDNERTIRLLVDLARVYVSAGVDILAPSTKNDAYVSHLKQYLIKEKLEHIPILAYGAKFASCLYGPFRNAANSAPKYGDRKSYQFPIGSRSLALRGIERDIEEGADYVMVKPGIFYLDIIREVASKYSHIPIAVYQVSGEYTMIMAGHRAGAFELKNIVFESCTSFKRAGARIIITYFTPLILDWIRSGEFTFE